MQGVVLLRRVGLLQALLQLPSKLALLPQRQDGEVADCMHRLRSQSGSLLMDSMSGALDFHPRIRDSLPSGILLVIDFID